MAEAATQAIQPVKDQISQEAQNPISLPFFIMMLEFAVLMDVGDLVEFIPVVGTVIAFFMSAIVGFILGVLMWAAGARGTRQLVTMLIGYIAEAVPLLSILPLNTLMVILVYLFSSSSAKQVLERAPGLAKKLPTTSR
ncbi:MAG: hypothetical protein ACK4NX_00915 [Candidatus Paceibacteria bacterium]